MLWVSFSSSVPLSHSLALSSHYFTGETGGAAIFLGAMILTALGMIAISSGGASMAFAGYDENRGSDPAYFQAYKQKVADWIGLSAAVVMGLGAALTFLTRDTLATLQDEGWNFAIRVAQRW